MHSTDAEDNRNRGARLFQAGIVLVGLGLALLGFAFYPVLREEFRYRFLRGEMSDRQVALGSRDVAEDRGGQSQAEEDAVRPADEDFGIVVPKISANAKVVSDVDAQDAREYQRALTQGVAHAKGTAYPGEEGNSFLFAHSGTDFYEASRFNAVFYLLNKLERGDDIYLFYQGRRYRYRVSDIKTASPDEVRYLDPDLRPGERKVTLMTCWPAGTALKRLIVVADQVEGE
jgi:LPXTG-site transpeptidase (sortase) family protein